MSRLPGPMLITGAASGIGLAVARRAAGDGAEGLVLVDWNAGALEAVRAELAASVRVDAHAFDVVDEAAWEDLEQSVRDRFGGLSAAVVNAGISDAGLIADLTLESWRRVLSVNLDGAFLTLRAALRLIEDGGAIAVVSSASAVKAEAGVGAYGASKAGLLQLTRVAAKEGAPRRVRVNAVLPGGVETPIWRDMPFFQDLIAQHGSERAAFDTLAGMATPLGRYAAPQEIAAQIAFLLSEDAGPITGAALLADGGYTL